jgi:hypothetical protein
MADAKQPRRRMTSLILAWLTGAALAYFFDPQMGTRRRHIARDRLGAMLRRGARQVRKWVRYLRGRAYGVVEEAVHLQPPDNPNPDEVTLTNRVESELFRDPHIPKGSINVNTLPGAVVELRGQLPTSEKINEVVERVRRVEGVREVHSYLHLPNTPAPNKEEALRVSAMGVS